MIGHKCMLPKLHFPPTSRLQVSFAGAFLLHPREIEMGERSKHGFGYYGPAKIVS